MEMRISEWKAWGETAFEMMEERQKELDRKIPDRTRG